MVWWCSVVSQDHLHEEESMLALHQMSPSLLLLSFSLGLFTWPHETSLAHSHVHLNRFQNGLKLV